MAAPSQYSLNTLKVATLERVFFSNTQYPQSVCYKHYLLNRENLTQPIQIQLYEKQKLFRNFSLPFPKSISNFKHLPKKHDPHR